jgi:hypothetical protein
MEALKILPGTGRGTMRSMVEGYRQVIATERGCDYSARPSTIGCADGPPPRSGEDL